MRKLTLVICLLAVAAAAVAQEKPAAPDKAAAAQANPLSVWNKHAYSRIQGYVLQSAEKVPESDYSFRPTESVRSFGQIIGHVADSQYYFCSVALGEKTPSMDIEKTKSSKADLLAALKESNAYCDKAYDAMTDAAATQKVKLMGNENTPKLAALNVNEIHDMEHYGNLVTYMRMKNIVPPSSEPKPEAKPAAK